MIDAAKANDRVLMVGQVERFNPAVEAVKRAIAGESVISIQITRVGPFPPRMGEVGVVIDLAVHDIDIIRHLTGSEVAEVQPQLARTRAEREDTALLQFRMDNGVIAHITTNWVTPYKTRTLQVATPDKFVVADLMTRQVTEYFGQQPDGSYSDPRREQLAQRAAEEGAGKLRPRHPHRRDPGRDRRGRAAQSRGRAEVSGRMNLRPAVLQDRRVGWSRLKIGTGSR